MLWKFLKGLVILTMLGVTIGYFESYRPPDTRANATLAIPQARMGSVFTQQEIRCVARIVFNESRNQSTHGQRAVAAVVINRSLSAGFKHTDICAVTKARGQFHNVTPKLHNAIERRAMEKAVEVAEYVTQNYGSLDPELRTFLYFNSNGPKRNSTTIGDHYFNA